MARLYTTKSSRCTTGHTPADHILLKPPKLRIEDLLNPRRTVRRRGLRAQATVTLVAVIVIATGAAVAAWPRAWLPISVVAAALAASARLLLDAFTRAKQEKLDSARVLRQHTQQSSSSRAELPMVREVSLSTLRTHTSVIDIPFIERDETETLRCFLQSSSPVLIIGPSMVGKTRLAAETVRYLYPEWPILIPESRNSLTALDAADMSISNTVVWLDDIERFLGVDGITPGGLQRLTLAGNIIIATVRAIQFDTYTPSNRLRPLEWDVLTLFKRVYLNRELSDPEKRRLAVAVPNEAMRFRIAEVGVGEYVGAAERISDQLKLGPNVNPIGYSLVLATVDWRRMGFSEPIAVDILRSLAANRLDAQRRIQLGDEDLFSAGLAWATKEINPTVSLLQPRDSNRFAVFDFVLDYLTAVDPQVPRLSWDLALSKARDLNLISLSLSAANAELRDVQQAALERASNSSDLQIRSLSKVSLGGIFREQGDAATSERLYREALDEGGTSSLAAISLGMLLIDQGRAEEAIAILDNTEDVPSSSLLYMAFLSLGQSVDKENIALAVYAYKRALQCENPEVAQPAALFLALTLKSKGESEEAQQFFQKTIETASDPKVFDMAVSELSELLASQGEMAQARRILERALEARSSKMLWRSVLSLAAHASDAEDYPTMQWALEAAILSGDPGTLALAALFLNIHVLSEKEMPDEIKRELRLAQNSANTFVATSASIGLAAYEARQGNLDIARALYEKVIEINDDVTTPLASAGLEKVLKLQADTSGTGIN